MMWAFKIFGLILRRGKTYSMDLEYWIFCISFLSCYIPLIYRFSAKYVREYIEGAKPLFSVGEYWDTCNYKGSSLDYNQGTSTEP